MQSLVGSSREDQESLPKIKQLKAISQTFLVSHAFNFFALQFLKSFRHCIMLLTPKEKHVENMLEYLCVYKL